MTLKAISSQKDERRESQVREESTYCWRAGHICAWTDLQIYLNTSPASLYQSKRSICPIEIPVFFENPVIFLSISK